MRCMHTLEDQVLLCSFCADYLPCCTCRCWVLQDCRPLPDRQSLWQSGDLIALFAAFACQDAGVLRVQILLHKCTVCDGPGGTCMHALLTHLKPAPASLYRQIGRYAVNYLVAMGLISFIPSTNPIGEQTCSLARASIQQLSRRAQRDASA